MRVSAAGSTHVGLVRDRNEDYVLVDSTRGLYIVADGMGGRRAGALASETAATTISEQLPLAVLRGIGRVTEPAERRELALKALTRAVTDADHALVELGMADAALSGMACTILAGLTIDGHLYMAHAGDVRAYLIRGGHIRQLTEDHSWVAELVGLGRIGADEARTHPKRHLVTRAIGTGECLEPALGAIALEPADWVLFCSDGLWSMLEDSQLLALVTLGGSPNDVVTRLVAEANSAGGQDNIACVILRASYKSLG